MDKGGVEEHGLVAEKIGMMRLVADDKFVGYIDTYHSPADYARHIRPEDLERYLLDPAQMFRLMIRLNVSVEYQGTEWVATCPSGDGVGYHFEYGYTPPHAVLGCVGWLVRSEDDQRKAKALRKTKKED